MIGNDCVSLMLGSLLQQKIHGLGMAEDEIVRVEEATKRTDDHLPCRETTLSPSKSHLFPTIIMGK